MKKKPIIIAVSGILVCVACLCAFILPDNDEINTNTFKYTLDLETYTPSDVKTGKYYLNGDTDSYYFEITDNTIQLCDTDPGELFTSWQEGMEAHYDPASVDEDLLRLRLDARERFINDFSKPRNYHIKTMQYHNGIPDYIFIEFDGKRGHLIAIKDENTLTNFGDKGDFILVEE